MDAGPVQDDDGDPSPETVESRVTEATGTLNTWAAADLTDPRQSTTKHVRDALDALSHRTGASRAAGTRRFPRRAVSLGMPCVPVRGQKSSFGRYSTVLEVERDGVRITLTRRDGSGRPLLIVPGVMADAAAWQPVVDALEPAGPVYVLNRRGRRPSGELGADYSVRTEIDDLDRVLDEIVAAEDAEQGVDLFGWSFGGLVALEAAARRPAAVHSLILYEPVVRPFGRHALGALREADEAGDLDRAVEIVNREVSGFSEEYVARLRRSPAWEVLRRLAAPLARELTALDRHPADLRELGTLDLPVTLLLGAENEGVPPYGDAFAAFASALPRARVVTMPGQGHLAHAQDPKSLARHIERALQETPQGAVHRDVETRLPQP